MKGLFILPVLLILLFGKPVFADWQKGLDAYKSGDYATALREFKVFAEQGDSDGQVSLALLYYTGEGVTQDYEAAHKWFTLAAEQGEYFAQYSLGLMYDEGQGVAQDYKTAVKWYKLAAEQGHVGSQNSLGLMYMRGEGVTQDYKTAVKWYKLATDQGHATSQNNLGLMYKYGRGVTQDYKTAIKWLKLAAEQGYALAQFNLGVMYGEGLGVTQDYTLAHMWLNIAASQGHENAMVSRDKVEKRMTTFQIAEAQKLAREFPYGSKIKPGDSSQITKPTPKGDNNIIPVSSGSGFAVSFTGHVVTNDHVIDGCAYVKVHYKGKAVRSTILYRDPINDLAVLQGDFVPSKVFKISRRNPTILQEIFVAGYPFGNRISSSIKVTKGIVSSLTGYGNNVSNIQIDAALQPGNSGGPIVDDKGNVIGVAVAKLDLKKAVEEWGVVPENTNFGVKSSVVVNLLESNGINIREASKSTQSSTELGKLMSGATYYLSCWMTMAQAREMATSKVMFRDLTK